MKKLKRVKAAIRTFLPKGTSSKSAGQLAPIKRAPGTLHLSLIVAAYNSEKYIDRLLASIFGQSSALHWFEVIVVDDGSTDGTAAIVRDWMTRYPQHLKYIHQENAGAGAARNAGLEIARGEWVAFPDSDDFLDVDYFKAMFKETRQEHELPLLAVISNLVFYHEDRDEFSDTHPLRYRFRSGIVRKPSDELDMHLHLSGATVWLHRPTLEKHGIRFDGRVVPGFEDAHLINRLFVAAPSRTVSFVPKAKYYYRKRADQSSLIDTAKDNPKWYLDQIEYGALDLIKGAKEKLGSVPKYIQRTCLYEVMWKHRYLVDHAERADILTNSERSKFVKLIEEVIGYIDSDVIEEFGLAGCTEEHKVALLHLYKKQRRTQPAVYLSQMDLQAGLAQFSYFSGGDELLDLRIEVNGREVSSVYPSRRMSTFLDRTYFRQHFFWIALEDGDEVAFHLYDIPCRIRRGSKQLGETATWLELRNSLQMNPPKDLSEDTLRLRQYVKDRRHDYQGAIVMIDRPDKADDNAEHLYRHMMATGRSSNAWFVLSESSADWPRLQGEGFRMLAYGSDEHIAAQMNAEFLVSSHADRFICWPVEKKNFQDLARFKVVFLQHGVIFNDLSGWFNGKNFRLFVATMPEEYGEIFSPDSRYVFSEREGLLSGLPRHDALLKASSNSKADTVLIAPTWRKYLTAESGITGAPRVKIHGFEDSLYARSWSSLLNSQELRDLSEREEVRIVFAMHPGAAMYLEDMSIPSYIDVVDTRTISSYQKLLVQAKVALTDYSSAITDVAYLQRPVVYFQFDKDEMFAGEHVCKEGYFSYEHHGFGPVVTTSEEVIAKLDDALSGREDPVYAARREASLPLRDGQCSERVCRAIEKISRFRNLEVRSEKSLSCVA